MSDNNVVDEYITQICEFPPDMLRVYKKAEHIIRGHKCKYFKYLNQKITICQLNNKEVTPKCFCCWAEKK